MLLSRILLVASVVVFSFYADCMNKADLPLASIESAIERAQTQKTPSSVIMLADFLDSNKENLIIKERVLLESLLLSKGSVSSEQQRIINTLIAKKYEGTINRLSCYKNVAFVTSAKRYTPPSQLDSNDIKVIQKELLNELAPKTENGRKIVDCLKSLH